MIKKQIAEKLTTMNGCFEQNYGFWKNGKGNAIGCTLEALAQIKHKQLKHDDLDIYKNELKIPKWLARVKNQIFEGLSEDKCRYWPIEFMYFVPDSNLDDVKRDIIFTVLEKNLEIIKPNTFLTEKIADIMRFYEKDFKILEDIFSQLEGYVLLNELDPAVESAVESTMLAIKSTKVEAENDHNKKIELEQYRISWLIWASAMSMTQNGVLHPYDEYANILIGIFKNYNI